MAVLDATASLLSMMSRWSTAINIGNNIGGTGDPPPNSADPGSGTAPSGTPPATGDRSSDPVVMSPGMLGGDALVLASPDLFVSPESDELPPAISDDPTAPGAGASDVAQSLSGLRPPRADPSSAGAWPTTPPVPAESSPAEPVGDSAPLALGATPATDHGDGGANLGTDGRLPGRAMDDPEGNVLLATPSRPADEADGVPQLPVTPATGAAENSQASRPTPPPEIPVLAAEVVASTDALMRDVNALRDRPDVDHGRPAEHSPDTASDHGRTEAARAAARQDSTIEVPVQRGADSSGIDGWSLIAATSANSAGDAQVGQTGIIASFILNAAMIPGWPPPKPFEMPSANSLLDRLLQGAKGLPNEEDYFAFLSERGAKPSFLARLRKRLDKLARSRRLRMLLGLAALMSTIEVVLEALEEELAQLGSGGGRGDEQSPLEEAEVRRSLTA